MTLTHPDTRIGHVHLKVSDLGKAVEFYTKALGFSVTERMGDSAAFLSAGGYHHHIGLNTWESKGGKPPARGTTGLYHYAILVPNRRELANALKRLIDYEWPVEGAADHGVSHAIYLKDPDENGIEIYYDLPREKWPKKPDGTLEMHVKPLDLSKLLEEAG